MFDKKRNFEDNIAFLVEESEKGIGESILMQGNLMDSQRFNETMSAIEGEINLLYQKGRALEDVISYTKEFLEQEIHIHRDKVKSKLKSIEDIRDSLSEKAYITYAVQFEKRSSEPIRDRDGSAVSSCHIENGRLVSSGQDLEEAKILDTSKKQHVRAYHDNLKDFNRTRTYRTRYILSSPAEDGVIEEVTFIFDGPRTINHVQASPVNCEIIKVAIVNENGVEEQVADAKSSYMISRPILGAKLTLRATDYKAITHGVGEFRGAAGGSGKLYENVLDYEKDMAIAKYHHEYNEYLDLFEEQRSDREAEAQRKALIALKNAVI